MRIVRAGEVDRPPAELDRTRRRPVWLASSAAHEQSSARSTSRELGRVRHGLPQRERPLEMREGLGEAEHGLRLARRLDRGDERFCGSTGGRPVRRELRWCRRSAAGELVGESSVQLLALTWEDRRVDRLGQERVAKAEGAAGLIGHEDAVLDRLAQ